MKYYLYISETKINMLATQIPKKIWEKYKAEVNINIEVFSASISKKETENTLYSKVNLIEKYIKKEIGIGTIGNPKKYFRGAADVNWGEWNSDSMAKNNLNNFNPNDVVFFKGKTVDTGFILVGSSAHMIGNYDVKPVHSRYVAPYFLSTLSESLKEPIKDEKSETSFREIHNLEFPGEKQRISFLAKKLLSKKGILIGSPIYVCLEE